jgi:prophage maintenance system killer protein
MDTFLRINGLRLTLPDREAYELTMSVATGDLTKRAIAAVLRRNTEPSSETR